MMTRTMLVGAASVAMMAVGMIGGPLLAQQAVEQSPQTIDRPAASQTATARPLTAVDDMKVYSAGGERVGEVEHTVIDPQGNLAFVVEIDEGFLGMAETEVVVPMDRLVFQGDRFQSRLTEEEMKALQAWD